MPPTSPDERQISRSALTGLHGVIATMLAIPLFAVGLVAWIPGLDERLLGHPLPPIATMAPVLAAGILGLATMFSRQRCRVYLTPIGLRIVSGRTEILVPMSQIQTVEHDTNTIVVTFREPTPLGSSIRFPFLSIGLIGPSVVDDLRQRAGLPVSQ
ncbi:MAG TPA: hypothetical protein VK733_00800 [Gemmatimonadaceae bacterium]|jgi:hypothetical protein|nr:hypothetical protein [Gemmatimonadaceae bacterium]